MSSTSSFMAASGERVLTRTLVFLLALGAGLAVASIYYAQPMLGVLGDNLQVGARTIGLIPTLTQLGYAAGILFLAPLGDRYDRRTIILGKALLLCASLLLAGTAQSVTMLLIASFATGLTATLAQDIVPAAATLAEPEHRGRTVGTVMTGLLLGILLSRVVSGFVAEHLGWRSMYLLAAASIALLAIALWRGLPSFATTTRLSYRALLGSLATLLMKYRALRQAALAQGLLSVGFSAFWSTLAVMLHEEPFRMGAATAGAFGLAGAAGALAAPMAGRIADRFGPQRVTWLGAGLAASSFGMMIAALWLPPSAQLIALAVGAIGFDLGVQSTLIAHQTIIYGLDAEARSRLNAVLMVSVFIGMSVGGALGSQALATWGWLGVMSLALVSALLALVVRVSSRQ